MRSFLSQQLQWLVKVQRNTPPQPSSASLVVECVFAFYCVEILKDTHWNLSLAEESFHWRQTLKANVQSVGFICICITVLKMLSSTSVAISFLHLSLSLSLSKGLSSEFSQIHEVLCFFSLFYGFTMTWKTYKWWI